MAAASGILKQVTYKAEAIFGTIPAATGPNGQSLRRVTSSLEMNKASYQSNEIRADYQLADLRHGVRTVGGTISGELSPKTYADFFAAALKKVFTAGVSATGLSITIAGSAGAWTITRSTGSWITDGFKQGDIMQLSAGAFNAANISKNVLIYALTATVATVLVLNGTVMVAEGPIATSTATVIGKKAFTPTTGHVDQSFSIEHWFPDVPTSEVFSGCKVAKITITLPATGMATIAIDFVGQNMTPAGTQYFTTPVGISTTGNLAAVNGVIRAINQTYANITGLTIVIDCGQDGVPSVGSNVVAALIPKRVIVTGTVTATFADTTMRDAFVNETEFSLMAAFTSDNTAASNFVGFNMPRIKFTDGNKDDGEKTLTFSGTFQALFNTNGGAGTTTDQTTLAVEDSAA